MQDYLLRCRGTSLFFSYVQLQVCLLFLMLIIRPDAGNLSTTIKSCGNLCSLISGTTQSECKCLVQQSLPYSERTLLMFEFVLLAKPRLFSILWSSFDLCSAEICPLKTAFCLCLHHKAMPSPLSVVLASFRLPVVINNGNKSAAGLFIKRFNQNSNTTQNSSKEIITQ